MARWSAKDKELIQRFWDAYNNGSYKEAEQVFMEQTENDAYMFGRVFRQEGVVFVWNEKALRRKNSKATASS